MSIPLKSKVRIHLTNIFGHGASQLTLSLLPAMEKSEGFNIEKIYLPNRGALAKYESANASSIVVKYKRFLPNILSRFLEVFFFAWRYNGSSAMLVLGDMPLNCKAKQTVFFHSPLLISDTTFPSLFEMCKYKIAQNIFRYNAKRVSAFIVQTAFIKEKLEHSYPKVVGRVHVIPQPPPVWLLSSNLFQYHANVKKFEKLNLFYPAADYPHKNHKLLSKLKSDVSWPVDKIVITLPAELNPASHLPYISCVGYLNPEAMKNTYMETDALLFLSKEESYGFPLIEAMYIGLPIICSDLAYAHTLCGDQAFYFDPDDIDSLQSAVTCMLGLLNDGWLPDWSKQLSMIPENWESVAEEILSITCDSVPV